MALNEKGVRKISDFKPYMKNDARYGPGYY